MFQYIVCVCILLYEHCVCTAVLYCNEQVAKRRATRVYTYGYARAEILGAFANSVLLCGLSMSVVVNAFERFLEPEPITSPQLMLVVGGIGLVVNLISLLMLFEYGGFGKARHEQEIEQARELLAGHAGKRKELGDTDSDADAYVEAPSQLQSGFVSNDEDDADESRDGDRHDPGVQVLLVPQVAPAGSSSAMLPLLVSSDSSLATQSKPSLPDASARELTQTPLISEFATAASSPRDSPSKSLPELPHANTNDVDANAGQTAAKAPANGKAAAVADALAVESGLRERRQHEHEHEHAHAHSGPRPKSRGHGHGHSHFGGGHGHSHHAGNMNIRGVLFHMMGDALGSLIVVLCAGIVWFFRDHLAAQALENERQRIGLENLSANASVAACEMNEPEHIFKRHWTSYLDPSLSCILAAILCYAGVSLCAYHTRKQYIRYECLLIQ